MRMNPSLEKKKKRKKEKRKKTENERKAEKLGKWKWGNCRCSVMIKEGIGKNRVLVIQMMWVSNSD